MAKAQHEGIVNEMVRLYGEDADAAQNLYDKLLIHYAEAMLSKSEKMKGRHDALYNLQKMTCHYTKYSKAPSHDDCVSPRILHRFLHF